MRFKIDENLPLEVPLLLNKNGHDAVSVFDQRLSGTKDPNLFEVCRNEARALITLDLDFANIQTYPPATTFGILVLRLVRQDKHRVPEVVEKLLPVLDRTQLIKTLSLLVPTLQRGNAGVAAPAAKGS